MGKLADQLSKYGDWALVAGAASGLGLAFSETLAACGKHLIMVDVNENALNSTADLIEAQFHVSVDRVVCDLAKPETSKMLMESVRHRSCRLIVYNAAYGPVKEFVAHDADELNYILDLNCRTLMQLAWSFSKEAPLNATSGFLAMSSMAGLRGTQLVAPYASSKAFIWNLMESLHYEYDSGHIHFSVLCAGPIATPNYLGTKPEKTIFTPEPQHPDFVAHEALRLLGNQAIGVPGIGNKINNFILSRLIPRSWSAKITNHVMGKMYRNNSQGR